MNKFALMLGHIIFALNCSEVGYARTPHVALILDGQTQKTVWLEVDNGAKARF